MSAHVVVEFTVKDPELYREQYAAKVIDVRAIAMDARFSLLDGIPTPAEDTSESE